MNDKSTFLITDPETGKDIAMNLVGYAKCDGKIFAVCTKPSENANASPKTAIFRIIREKIGPFQFGLIDEPAYCQKVMDAFIEAKIEEKEKQLKT